jgi:flavin-dependent dehydrogenase
MNPDVAIVGGGMAGSFLARQLLRTVPGIRVALFERSTDRTYKVGESTVEIASRYMIRRLGLSSYLYEHQLPKNGLRYFFDDESRSAEFTEMTELGTMSLPFHPSFQLDRSTLDGDLLEMNANAGVDVRMGARVSGLEFGEGGAPHHFEVESRGRRERVACRWFVDAGGRSSLVARAKGLRVAERGHSVEAAWGRFEGVADVDDWGDAQFSARTRHTCRGLSTLHFCYPGYWIWFIRLRNGLTSIGFVGHPPGWAPEMNTEAGFRAFLDGHRAIASLLTDAKAVDLIRFKHLSYQTSQYFSADRFGLTGDAAAFADPFYSPGADFIALENDFLTDLIRRDLGGEAEPEFRSRVQLYDEFMQFRFEAAMRLYRRLYGLLGSFELTRLKWDFDIGSYHNLWVSPYMQDDYLDADFLRQQLRQKRFILQALANFSELFQKTEAHLRRQGSYYRSNLGDYSHGLEHIDFIQDVGLPRDRQAVLDKAAEMFNGVRGRALGLLDRGGEPDEKGDLPLMAFMTPRPIA